MADKKSLNSMKSLNTSLSLQSKQSQIYEPKKKRKKTIMKWMKKRVKIPQLLMDNSENKEKARLAPWLRDFFNEEVPELFAFVSKRIHDLFDDPEVLENYDQDLLRELQFDERKILAIERVHFLTFKTAMELPRDRLYNGDYHAYPVAADNLYRVKMSRFKCFSRFLKAKFCGSEDFKIIGDDVVTKRSITKMMDKLNYQLDLEERTLEFIKKKRIEESRATKSLRPEEFKMERVFRLYGTKHQELPEPEIDIHTDFES